MKGLSEIAKRLEGQKMFQILARTQELERQGKSIIHFEIGDPNFDTPMNIKEACCDAIMKGYTHYTPSKGFEELLKTSADITLKSRGFKPDRAQLLVSPTNYQIALAISCSVNPGEEVIIPDPSFVTYHSKIISIGAKPVGIPLYEENEFRLNPLDVEKAITDKTRLIIINSPSNPTGAVMTEEEIREIYKIAEKHDIYLLSDEVYARHIYEDTQTKFFSPSIIDKCNERVIIVNGFSKSYAMTGWRMGVSTGPEELIEKMRLLLETDISCFPPFIQKAAVEALLGDQQVTFDMKDEYKKRRDVLVEGLNSLPGITCLKPKGAFYAFPNIKKTGMTSEEFSKFLLDEAGIAVCPGNFFGEHGEGYVRLCYASCSLSDVKIGISRMKELLHRKI